MCITNLYINSQQKITIQEFPARFEQKWRRLMPDTLFRKKIFSYHQEFFIVDREHGILPVSSLEKQQGENFIWCPEKSQIVDIQPGFASEPLILLADGDVFRWSNTNTIKKVFESTFSPKNSTIYGLPNNKILIREKASLSVYTEAPFGQEWSFSIRINQFFIIDDILILFENAGPSVRAFNLQTYRQLWHIDSIPDQLTSFIGFYNGLIWTNALEGKVIGFDIENGRRKVSIDLKNHFNPSGVLDSTGRYHVCNGLNYEILDLNSFSSIKFSNFLEINPSVSTAAGNCSILIENHNLLFFDDQGKLFISSDEGNNLEGPLWQSDDVVMSYGVQDHLLFVLERNKNLTVLGD